MTAEPLHARVAGWLERAFNPILVKELRGSLRGARFFAAHMTVLALFAAALLIALGVVMAEQRRRGWYGAAGDPALVGRGVYLVTQILHLGVVFLVVPGLAATSITVERESLTHDLLVTTTLRAHQIVWGKFSAALFQAFTLFVSLLPLVGLTFLFGGITVYQIVANYAFLLGLSALMIAFALFVSSHAASTQRAVGSVYGMAFLGGLLVSLAVGGVADARWDLAEAALSTYGFVSEGTWTRARAVDPIDRLLYLHIVPGYLAVALFSLFFVGAVNRLKPLFANRSTNLRVYAVAAVAGLLAVLLAIYRHEYDPDEGHVSRAEGMMGAAIGALALGLLLALFACDDAVVAPHLRVAGGGPRSLFRPGAGPGAAFAALLSALFALALFAGLLPLTGGFNQGAWAGLPPFFPWLLACGTAASWGLLCALYGRWASAVLGGRPMLIRLLLFGGAFLLAVAPLLHWAVATEIDRDARDVRGIEGTATLLLSPVAAVLAALDLSASLHRDFPLTALGIPIPAGHTAVSLLLSVLFLVLGNRASRPRARNGNQETGNGEQATGNTEAENPA